MVRKSGLPKHCSWNWDRHGKKRVRFRLRSFSTYLAGIPYSEDFMRQYHAALEGVKARADVGAGSERTRPGSVNALIVAYYNSREFISLAESTQRERRYIIEAFRKEHGDKPAKLLKTEHIEALLDAKARTPQSGNNLLKSLKLICKVGKRASLLDVDPTVGIAKLKSKREGGYHTWTEEEIDQFESVHAIGSRPRLALALMLWTSAAKSDAIRLGPQHVRAGRLTYSRKKTGVSIDMPLPKPLAEIIAASPSGHLTFLITKHGRPYTSNGFGNAFREWCNEAGLPQCSSHGLRKACARRLAESGVQVSGIMSVTGHRDPRMALYYAREADKKKLADEAMSKTLIRMESERNSVQPTTRLDKMRS